MKHLAEDNDLKYGKDVKMISQGNSIEFKSYLDQNQNKTTFGVLFCTTDWTTKVDISNTTMAKYAKFEQVGFDVPCQPSGGDKDVYMYSIMYNYTLVPFNFTNIMDCNRWDTLTRIKTSVDNGILRELQKKNTGSYEGAPKIQTGASKYPNVPDRAHAGFDTSAVFGSLYFFIPSLTIFTTIFNMMMREKTQKLRLGLHVFGLSSASHWTASTITAIFFSCIPAMIFPVFGEYFMMGVFQNAPYLLNFIIFFFCSFSMCIIAFLLVTLVDDEKTGNVI